jgi:hypothetical protein
MSPHRRRTCPGHRRPPRRQSRKKPHSAHNWSGTTRGSVWYPRPRAGGATAIPIAGAGSGGEVHVEHDRDAAKGAGERRRGVGEIDGESPKLVPTA